MPTIDLTFNDLELLVGKSLPRNSEELTDLLAFAKGEVESFENGNLSVEIKDGNRPDLWSVEGIARTLRGALGIDKGLQHYHSVASSGVEIIVNPKLQNIRPYIASAVVKNLRLSDGLLREFMRLQDKFDQTYGRKRSRTSIGLYNYRLISPPLHYTVAKPTEIIFTPLESQKKMNLQEILDNHPKGQEYGHIVNRFTDYPILLDDKENVLSFPPIINSNYLGKITPDTTDILVEVTGTDHQTVTSLLTLVVLSFADRGGDVFTTRVLYPYPQPLEDVVPNFTTSKFELELTLVNKILGLDLSQETIIQLLRRARYDADPVDNATIMVLVPCYRVDIMHPIDLIEDIAIMYGYNNIEPKWPQLLTFGEITKLELKSDLIREVMIGLGFQEILSFSMSTPQKLFGKMNLKSKRIVEIANPINERFTCLRSWLIPSLMEFLSNNTHVRYPQKVFEVGDCSVLDKSSKTGIKDLRKLACLLTSSAANFSEIKAVLEALLLNLGVSCDLEKSNHGTFIDGRVGSILINDEKVGIIGEISPKVLEEWKLENPTVGFEIELNKLSSFGA